MLKNVICLKLKKFGLEMNEDKWHITDGKSFQYDSDDDPFDFIKEN